MMRSFSAGPAARVTQLAVAGAFIAASVILLTFKALIGVKAEPSARAFMVVGTVTNPCNDKCGVLYKPNFPYGVNQGDIKAELAESLIGGASLWEIRIGAEYRF